MTKPNIREDTADLNKTALQTYAQAETAAIIC